MNWTLLFFCVVFAALIGRLFFLQIVSHRDYVTLAAKQHRIVQEISPERGGIFMQDKSGSPVPLAVNRVYKTLIVSPKLVVDPDFLASYLAAEFSLDKETLLKRFSNKDDEYEVIARKVEPDHSEQIEQKKLVGVFFQEEKLRVYPHGAFASQVVGFVSKQEDKEEGKYGLERFYEKELAGTQGVLDGSKDVSGFWVALGRRIINPSKDGSHVYTSIDYNIQLKAEDILGKLQKKWQSASGIALVIEPKTGRILAMANVPTFDPNMYSKEKNFSVFLNPAVQAMYELGSVMKPITMASALHEHIVTPEKTYIDTGEVKFGTYTIRNFDEKAYGLQTMSQVIENSLNTGMVFVSRILGKEKQLDYVKRFGFGQKTNIDLGGEVNGSIVSLEKGKDGKDIDFATASFGQGIAVTPIQLAAAIGAIANQGKLMKPYVVDRVVDDSGNTVVRNPVEVRSVISQDASEATTKMMVAAVRNGFENHAGVKGYFVAGKTGTAQIPKTDGRGYSDTYIHTFVGFAPAFNPKFLVLLELVDPKGNRFAANTLTPAFHDLAQFILNYYEIPPDEK